MRKKETRTDRTREDAVPRSAGPAPAGARFLRSRSGKKVEVIVLRHRQKRDPTLA